MISLKDLAIRGTAWTVLGYGSSQLLRLGSNLVLTRILAPEIFGIMALVNVLLVGLNMFSDIGIGPNIIQSDRGDNPEFLNTAWTIQIIRGFGIWICACIGAWPFSRFYGEPQLAWIIPIVSLGAAISGYNSTGIFTANRHLKFHRITLIELGSQCLAIAVMVVWAAIKPTVWALVAGSLTGATLKMVASHIWLSNIPHKWMRKWDEIKSITRFGRWIFISTILGFLVNSGDRLILGKFLSLEALGIYSIAFMIANFFRQIHEQVSSKILFPLYRKIKHLPLGELRTRIRKIRISVMITFLPPLWFVVIFGQEIINFLFDIRYREAGWMLQVLSSGLIPIIIIGIGPFYLALGHSFLLMNLVALRAVFFVSSMIIGGVLHGSTGLIYGIAAHNIMVYFVDVLVQIRYSIWQPKLDILGLLSSGAALSLGLWIRGTHQWA